MTLPDIDFNKIRPHRGQQSTAFEELCCQLATDAAAVLSARFVRKGLGADGGVEAFAVRLDGSEVGWQVKFYWDMASALRSLDGSFATALRTHPQMNRFIACIPFDPSDGRKEGQVTALDRWTDWRTTKIAEAAAAGRTVEIELWSSAELKGRLVADAKAAGRIAFWFDETVLSPAWFSERLERSLAALGARYTPETNVDLPIRRAVQATTRDPTSGAELSRIRDVLEIARSKVTASGADVGRIALEATDAALQHLREADGIEPSEDYPQAAIHDALALAGQSLRDWRRELGDRDDLSRAVSRLHGHISRAQAVFDSDRWQLINARRLLVFGEGGRGKSHLLADVCKHQIDAQLPALLIPSSHLTNAEPWAQIVNLLDLPRSLQVGEFLGALNSSAQADGVRALIVIDGLNERDGQQLWSSHLASFLKVAEAFLWITVVVSCRSTYLQTTIPKPLSDHYLPRLEHVGFSVAEAETYLEYRGFTTLEAPWPLEEFQTPLFLKTLCDGLAVKGVSALPRGARGVSGIFAIYAEAIAEQINREWNFNPRLRYVERALEKLAEEMAVTVDASLPYLRADEIVQAILPHHGAVERDLVHQLASAGALTVEPGLRDSEELVRFTFERYGDFTAAAGALAGCIGASDLERRLAGEGLLARFLGSNSYQLQGVLEALAVLIPERFGVELVDLPLESPAKYFARRAFDQSLGVREVAAFSARTWEIIRDNQGDANEWDVLIRLAGEADVPYHGPDLHAKLLAMPMPKRDAIWSIYLAQEGRTAEVLIDWALGIRADRVSSERVRGIACTIGWFFTTSHRRLRDRATKALASLLADHPKACIQLLEAFATIDDGYVTERLLCAIYGAALQGRWPREAATEVAGEVDRRLFLAASPPANCLTREYARLLLQWAVHTGALPTNYNLASSQGPFATPWPIEHVSDATIDSFTRTYPTGAVFRDEIVSSCVEDGDFARYVLDRAVNGWAPAPRGTRPLPTRKMLHERWEKWFLASATPAQQRAYDDMTAAIAVGREESPYHPTPEEKDAKATFESAVGTEVYETWREEAENWRRHGMYQSPMPRDHAQFNLAWARRWVCLRAHQLGWSEALHGKFDMHLRNDRMTHSVERIGKKYQWLALYELRARMSDNLEPVEAQTRAEPDDQRNIDPSLLAGLADPSGQEDDGVFRVSPWQNPIVLGAVALEDALVWRDDEEDLEDDHRAVELEVSGQSWLTLRRLEQWRGGPDALQRQLSRWVICVVVRKRNLAAFLRLVNGETGLDHDRFHPGESRVPWRSFLGEHPWAWPQPNADGWLKRWTPRFDPSGRGGVAVRATTLGYLAESRGYDGSMSTNVEANLPAAWLIEAMGLKLGGGDAIRYVDAAGTTLFQDPNAATDSPMCSVVDRTAFLSMLEREGLAAVWLVEGEKNVYGSTHSRGFGGRLTYARTLFSTGGALQLGSRTVAIAQPSRDQLEALVEATNGSA